MEQKVVSRILSVNKLIDKYRLDVDVVRKLYRSLVVKVLEVIVCMNKCSRIFENASIYCPPKDFNRIYDAIKRFSYVVSAYGFDADRLMNIGVYDESGLFGSYRAMSFNCYDRRSCIEHEKLDDIANGLHPRTKKSISEMYIATGRLERSLSPVVGARIVRHAAMDIGIEIDAKSFITDAVIALPRIKHYLVGLSYPIHSLDSVYEKLYSISSVLDFLTLVSMPNSDTNKYHHTVFFGRMNKFNKELKTIIFGDRFSGIVGDRVYEAVIRNLNSLRYVEYNTIFGYDNFIDINMPVYAIVFSKRLNNYMDVDADMFSSGCDPMPVNEGEIVGFIVYDRFNDEFDTVWFDNDVNKCMKYEYMSVLKKYIDMSRCMNDASRSANSNLGLKCPEYAELSRKAVDMLIDVFDDASNP